MLSFAVAGIMPMIDAYGIFMTSMFSALLAWTGFGWVPSPVALFRR